MIEEIKNQLGSSILNNNTLLTADTGYSSEANMEYLFKENINAVIPDNNFRQRDPKFSTSETVKKHKAHRQKTRKDQSKGALKFSSSEFTVNKKTKICICPSGHKMMYHGDHFVINNKRYLRFKSYLKNCRDCSLQSQCMKKPVKEHGRQVSFVVEEQSNVSYLDLMKQKIDSDAGKKAYAKRMWTIEPVFGNITSNKGLNKLSLRGKAKVTSQWMIFCMIHNIEKLWRYGQVQGI